MNNNGTTHLNQYTVYKPSGIPWLGQLPNHWEPVRIQHLASPEPKSFTDGDWIESPYITTGGIRLIQTGNVGVGEYVEKGYRFISDTTFDELKCTEVKPGDILICRLGDPVARACAAPELGRRMITSVDVCIVKCGKGKNSRFAIYAMSSRPYLDWVSSLVRGSTRDRISRSMLGKFVIPIPPPEEQAAIVRFLDHADEQIRRYIASKERLIALLEEERQALVHQAVTRGLDPDVKLKDSGVEWLGEVPEHWGVGPLKHAFLSMDYGISESASDSGTVRLLTMAHLRDGKVTVPKDGGVDYVDPYLLLQKGDLLFNRTNSRELVGKVGLFDGHGSPVTFASYLVRMRPHPSHEAGYLNMVLNDTAFLSQARREAIPSLHQSNLNPTRYGRMPFVLPPQEEQRAILRTVKQKTTGLRDSISHAHRQLDLIKEYRTRLIADVVTGQVDVREAADKLTEPVAKH